MIIFHDPLCIEYSRTGHPERPDRITRTESCLKARHGDWEWRVPQPAPDNAILRAHTNEHVERLRDAIIDFDGDTPAHPGIYKHAARAAGAAIEVATAAVQGTRAFSLMRPPGHHATRDRAMGFCYLSNTAIAALEALNTNDPDKTNGRQRVAIWDFDAHHGNGTEDIVGENQQIAFASVHQFPGYPGTGTRSFDNIHNFPVAPGTTRANHLAAARRALDRLIEFKPDLLLVSAGFDAFSGDPITEMTLEVDDFATLGRWLLETNIPAGAILEGGYSDNLPELIDRFLSGWNG